MKLKPMFPVLVATALLGSPALAVQGGPGGPGGGTGGSGGNGPIIAYIDTLPLETIDAQEHADLLHMRQEEKLARDVYRVLYQAWGISAFDNISDAEQSHMDLTLVILDRYGIVDPLTSDVVGEFPDPAFTSLYRRIVLYGMRSPFHALNAGGLIEELDIYDLDFTLANTDNRDIATVWQNLIRGSRNHLRSFHGLLIAGGYRYFPKYLTTARIRDIVDSPAENEPVDENGVVLP